VLLRCTHSKERLGDAFAKSGTTIEEINHSVRQYSLGFSEGLVAAMTPHSVAMTRLLAAMTRRNLSLYFAFLCM
jgi:hypothetical protein